LYDAKFRRIDLGSTPAQPQTAVRAIAFSPQAALLAIGYVEWNLLVSILIFIDQDFGRI
jgi:hypothetical protein